MAPLTPRFLALVGLMGSGKSSVAQALAERWSARDGVTHAPSYRAIDLDAIVVEAAEMSIADVFRLHGEPAFRTLEAAALDRVLAASLAGAPTILATGGGAPCQPGAMDKLLDHGPVVWLDASPEVLVHRALDATRPLLAGKTRADAEAVLAAQLATRKPFYARASLRVDATRPLADVVAAIDDAVHDDA